MRLKITEQDVKDALKLGFADGYAMAEAKYKRQHGEWIKITSPLSAEIVIKCPFCHDEFIGNDVEDYNYCPICGADMRGGENE